MVIYPVELSSEDVLLLAKIASRLGFEVRTSPAEAASTVGVMSAFPPVSLSEKSWIQGKGEHWLGRERALRLIEEGYTLLIGGKPRLARFWVRVVGTQVGIAVNVENARYGLAILDLYEFRTLLGRLKEPSLSRLMSSELTGKSSEIPFTRLGSQRELLARLGLNDRLA